MWEKFTACNIDLKRLSEKTNRKRVFGSER